MRSAASPLQDRPLAGRTVVVCRPESEAGPLIADLEALGASAVAEPLHRMAPPADAGAALLEAARNLDGYAWVAVTSANGVRSLADNLTAGVPDSTSVAAVGPATAAAFTELGIHVHLVPHRATAADLADAFPLAKPGDRVLAPLNEAAADTLVDGLEAKGYLVDRVDAYRMIPTDSDLDGDHGPVWLARADVVVFTAPSQVTAFVERFGPEAAPPVIACIGPRTTASARAAGLAPIDPPSDHTAGGLIDALVASLRTEAVVSSPSHQLDTPEKKRNP